MNEGKLVTLLLVEDDEIDEEALHRSFRKLKITNPIVVAHDGIEALDILRGTGGKEKLLPPYIVLLDINMPRMNGLEFLEEIRKDKELKRIVVFVLTTSNDDVDKMKAYESHVAGYALKSNAGDSFIKAVEMLDHYWKIIELPGENTLIKGD